MDCALTTAVKAKARTKVLNIMIVVELVAC